MTPARHLLPHVQTERLLALESQLEEASQLSLDFLVLLAGSTVIATLGLFQNSPAVIIGAMIIAPLMRPLMGLSLASLTADIILLRRALATLVVGTTLGGAIAFALASVLQSIETGPEILARTRPTLMDLGVAFFAGVVGAYCHTNEKLSDTLAGVAIAVALVPPLSVVGIGLALHSPAVATGAALLYATNLVGISIAGSLVFLAMGYTPLRQARKGLFISGALLCLLIVPLAFSMKELLMENDLRKQIKTILSEQTQTFKTVRVRDIEVRRFQRPMRVVATVFGSPEQFTTKQVKLVKEFLRSHTGVELDFKLRVIPQTEITAVEVTPETITPAILPLPLSPPEPVSITPVEEAPDLPSPAPQAEPKAHSQADQPGSQQADKTAVPDR